jgi:hypothetical protein
MSHRVTSIGRRDATARAAWSVALPVSGWVLSIALLVLSGHVGNVTSTAGLNQGNRAGALAFLVAGAMDVILGTVGIILAVTAKRTQTAPNAQSWKGLATAGLVLNPILVAMGVMALLVGAFLYEFATSWNF